MKLRKLLEGMGDSEYTPPSDPRQLMADFYTIQLLDSRPAGTPSHRNDNLSYEVRHVKSVLYPYLREHLLDKAGYAIVCEMRHVFDAAKPHGSTYGEPGRIDRVAKWLRSNGISNDLCELLLDCAGRSGSDGRRPSYYDVMFKDKRACATLGPTAFGDAFLEWENGYGGKPWVMACNAWMSLYNAKSVSDVQVYCDKVYSVQHNTGNLLDKNPEYSTGSYDWITKLLDLKFKATDPEQISPYASPYVRRLAGMILHANYSRGWDHDQYGSPVKSAIGELAKSSLNSAISQLKANGVDLVRIKEHDFTPEGSLLGAVYSIPGVVSRVSDNGQALTVSIYGPEPQSRLLFARSAPLKNRTKIATMIRGVIDVVQRLRA